MPREKSIMPQKWYRVSWSVRGRKLDRRGVKRVLAGSSSEAIRHFKASIRKSERWYVVNIKAERA